MSSFKRELLIMNHKFVIGGSKHSSMNEAERFKSDGVEDKDGEAGRIFIGEGCIGGDVMFPAKLLFFIYLYHILTDPEREERRKRKKKAYRIKPLKGDVVYEKKNFKFTIRLENVDKVR